MEKESYSDLSRAALGFSHIILNPDILFSIVSCCTHVGVVFPESPLGFLSRSYERSEVMTLLMKAHSIMADIRWSLVVS